MQNFQEILKKLKRLAEESTFEGETVAAQAAYDRLFAKFKDKERISEWDLTNNELALLAKYDITYISESALDVPQNDQAMDVALNFLLKNALKKKHKNSSLEKEEIKCLQGAKLNK